MRYSAALVIGAMKAGTTSVYDDLRMLDGVEVRPKEEGIFSRGLGTPWPTDGDSSCIIEICSDYSMIHRFPEVPWRVAEELGRRVPIIYLLRDPIERARSHLQHLTSLGQSCDPEDLLDPGHHVVMTSRYGWQTRRWREVGHENIHFIDFHQLVEDRDAPLRSIADVIGIAPNRASSGHRRSASNPTTELRSARRWLRPAVRSQVYQQSIRPLIPRAARKRLKLSSLTRAPAGLRIPESIQRELFDIFRDDLSILRDNSADLPVWVGRYLS